MIIQGLEKTIGRSSAFIPDLAFFRFWITGVAGSNLLEEVSQCPVHLLLESSSLIFMEPPDVPAQPKEIEEKGIKGQKMGIGGFAFQWHPPEP
jgi:hypothetical protein